MISKIGKYSLFLVRNLPKTFYTFNKVSFGYIAISQNKLHYQKNKYNFSQAPHQNISKSNF